MKRIVFFSFLLLFLSGCFGNMEKGLVALMGEDATTAFNVIGYPTGKNMFEGKTVYFWSVDSSSVMFLPQSNHTQGMVGSTPYYGTTTYNQAVPMHCSCLIKLIADEQGKLISWEWNGNMCGCKTYIERLSRYYKSQQ